MRNSFLGSFVPPGPAGRRLAVIAFVGSLGTGLYLASSAVFAVLHVGLSHTQFGWAMSAAGVVGLLGTVPLGKLGDRIGPRRLLVILQLWRAVWFTVLGFTGDVYVFTLVVCCLGLAEAAIAPLTQVVVASAVGDADRVRTNAILRMLRNAGFSVGALAAAPLLVAGTVWAFRSVVLANAVSFVVAAAILSRLDIVAPAPVRKAGRGLLAALASLRDLPYLRLAALNTVLVLHMSLLSVGIPLWVVSRTDAPVGLVAVLTAVNTVMAVLLQVPMSRPAETEPGAVRCFFRAGLALGVSCLGLAWAGEADRWTAVAVLVASMVAMTFGEILQSAGAWELSYRHAPDDRRTEYLAVFNLGFSAQQIAGPVLFTGVVIALGAWGWAALAVVFCVAGALVRPANDRLAAHRRQSVPAAGPSSTAVAPDG
ncbi:MFS transporter [Streptomyces sp. NPDC004051]